VRQALVLRVLVQLALELGRLELGRLVLLALFRHLRLLLALGSEPVLELL
jgi:hypothetical protein